MGPSNLYALRFVVAALDQKLRGEAPTIAIPFGITDPLALKIGFDPTQSGYSTFSHAIDRLNPLERNLHVSVVR
jgi:hypothetical protein